MCYLFTYSPYNFFQEIQGPDSSKPIAESHRLHPSLISFILVQVKNYQEAYDSFIKIAREKVHPEVCKLIDGPADFPFLSLYMQLGSKGKEMAYIQELPEIQQQFVTDGNYSHPKFDQNTLDSLKKYQMGLATFGLDESIFPCLTSSVVSTDRVELKNLIELLQELLVSWPDPASMHGNVNSDEN